jgi:hypothetical protein
MGAIAIVAVVLVAVLWGRAQDKLESNRVTALETAARESGWDFPRHSDVEAKFHALRGDIESNAAPGTAKWLADELLHSRSGVTFNPVVRRDGTCVLFDYTTWNGTGQMRDQVWQTVVYVRSERLALPVLSIRPLRTWLPQDSARNERKFGFGRCYDVRSDGGGTADALLSEELRAYLMQNSGISVNGAGNEIFIFRRGNLAAPNQIVQFASWAESVARMFVR